MWGVKRSWFARTVEKAAHLVPVVVVFAVPAVFPLAQTNQAVHPRTGKSSVWKLAAVKVTGSQRYQPDEIVASAGLQIGQTVTDEDFQKASERLGEIGVFDNVTYTYEYSGDDVKL